MSIEFVHVRISQCGLNLCSLYLQTVHLGKPEEVMDDGGGAALDLHQWDLIFSCHQDVFLVVKHSCQVHAPKQVNIRRDQRERRTRRSNQKQTN